MHFKIICLLLACLSASYCFTLRSQVLLYSEVQGRCVGQFLERELCLFIEWKRKPLRLQSWEREWARPVQLRDHFLLVFQSPLWSSLPCSDLWQLLHSFPPFLLPLFGFFLLLNKLNWFYVCNSFFRRVWRWSLKALLSSKARNWSKQHKSRMAAKAELPDQPPVRVLCWRNTKAYQLNYAGSCW